MQSILDFSFSLLFIGPMTVLFWRGTFNALTYVAFEGLHKFENRWFPALILYLTGMFMKITIDLTKHYLREILMNKGFYVQSLATSILLYLDAFFGVAMWVGAFNLLYVLPGLYWYSLTGTLCTASIILMAIRAFHCTSGVPLAIYTDEFENVFNPSNYFGSKLERGSLKVILDTVFTYSFVHTLVICCWWGMWELENRYILFPCEITIKDIQAWDSIVIGYFLIILVIGINKSAREVTDEDGQITKLVTGNFVAFLSFVGTLNFWRGVWSLLDFYFFPSLGMWENLLLSNVVGFLGTLFSGSSLCLTQSSEKDASDPNFYNCKYFSKYGLCGKSKNQYENLDQQPSETSPLISQV